MAEVLFRFAADDGGAVGDGDDRAEGDAGVCDEGFGRVRGRCGGGGIGIARPSGHCADYDHAGWFGADDELVDDHGAAAGGESDRVFAGWFQRIQYVQRWECA